VSELKMHDTHGRSVRLGRAAYNWVVCTHIRLRALNEDQHQPEGHRAARERCWLWGKLCLRFL